MNETMIGTTKSLTTEKMAANFCNLTSSHLRMAATVPNLF